MADLKISELTALAGANLATGDELAIVDTSASETKKITLQNLIESGVDLIDDSSIPGAKILFGTGEVPGTALATGAVSTDSIAADAITAAKIANEATCDLVTTLPASGGYTGQLALDTDDNKVYIWDGSAWQSVKGAGSVNSVVASTSGIVNITVTTSGDTVTIGTTLDDTTAAANFLAGPTGAAGSVGYRAIAGSDLPKATSSTKGAVVVNGSGLTMSNDEIQIDNTVTAETTNHHVVQYDANGLITAGRQIAASDIPSATSSVKGSVFPGTGLGVTADGELNHNNNITAGTFTKVTVDTEGHVTAGLSVVAADIPDLPASKITTGTVPTERIANDAITAEKLGNESTTVFIGAGATDNVVTFPDGDFKGQFAYDEKNEDLYVYTGNSFIPITVISGNLVNAGTYNASTNLLTSVTTAGSAAGFTSGSALPTPANTNLNYYVVVDTSGTGSGAAPAVALAPPDMLVSLGTGSTFQLVDVSNAIAGQTAANISVVPVGSVAATDVQAAIQELDTEKLPKAGGTMTGNLELGSGIVIVFEGSTADDYETTLTVADPTSDHTITLPDVTGTVVTTGDTGSVTSTMILDGTIANADISATAEIAVSKLANGTARQLLQTDATGANVEFTSDVDVPGTLDVTGAGTFDSSLTVTGVINADGKIKFPAGTAALPSFYNGTDTDTGLYFSAADEISVSTGGTQRVVVDSSGNVGIGAASPSQLLHVQGTGVARLQVTGGASDSARINFGDTSDEDIGQIIYDNSNDSLQFVANAGEKARITSSGELLLNHSASRSIGSSDAFQAQLEGTTAPTSGISIVRNSADANPAQITLGKSRGTATGANTVVQDDDTVAVLAFAGADGTDLEIRCAQIDAAIDGTPGANDMPGRLVFSTTADGASSVTEAMRIDSKQRVTVKAGAIAEIDTLTSGSTVTPDFATSCNFSLTLGVNLTIANPSNLTAGQSGSIFLVQDGTGSRTAAFGSYWDFAGGTAPTLSTAAAAVDRIDYIVRTSTSIHAVFTANYS